MKSFTDIEQAALEAYPENVGYDSIIEKLRDYNLQDRSIFIQGEKKGYQIAIDKACEYINHYCNRHGVHPTRRVEIIEEFRKAMEDKE